MKFTLDTDKKSITFYGQNKVDQVLSTINSLRYIYKDIDTYDVIYQPFVNSIRPSDYLIGHPTMPVPIAPSLPEEKFKTICNSNETQGDI